jgi:hypothetical protein
MKIIAILLLTLTLGKGCGKEEQNDIKNAVVEYEANTRGYYQKVTIQNQMVTVSKDRKGQDKPEPRKIPDTEWKVLISAFQELSLDDLPQYKGPTEMRFYDGAAMANLKITYKEKTYESQTFDHGHPPVEIERFVNQIVSLANEE